MNKFAERLSELIDNCGKSQNEISTELKITKFKFSRWKNDLFEPGLDDLIMIANYFEVSTDYLLGLEDETGAKTNLTKKRG